MEDFLKQLRHIPIGAEEILINYHNSPYKLEVIEKGDWCDLYVTENVTMKAGERRYISQGISMKLPQGYEAIMAPRSSTFKRYGILQTNSIGVIDNSYCGDDDYWLGCVYATRDITIPANTRCFQFRLIKTQPMLHITSVDSLGNENRNGFGSSGD